MGVFITTVSSRLVYLFFIPTKKKSNPNWVLRFLVPGSFSTCWTSSKQGNCQKVHFLGGKQKEKRMVHSDGRSQVCAAGCGGSPSGEATVYTWRTARPPRRVWGTRSQTRRCGENIRSPGSSPLGSPPVSTRRTATSLTTCGLPPSPPLLTQTSPSLPEEGGASLHAAIHQPCHQSLRGGCRGLRGTRLISPL